MFKISSGKFKGTPLLFPKTSKIRPLSNLVRQAVFNFLDDFIDQANVLDLYAGTGVFGLEALSLGAKHVTFVDVARQSIRLIEANVEKLGLKKRTTILQMDSFDYLLKARKKETRFQVVFLDPPFDYLNSLDKKDRDFYCLDLLDRIKAVLGAKPIIVFKHPEDIKMPIPQGLKLFETRNYGINTISYIVTN